MVPYGTCMQMLLTECGALVLGTLPVDTLRSSGPGTRDITLPWDWVGERGRVVRQRSGGGERGGGGGEEERE